MPHTPLPPFAASSGPRSAKIAAIGEAWGESEERVGRPFVGYSGQELDRMLGEAGIEPRTVFKTNVLALRPPNNKLEALCVKRAEAGPGYPMPPLSLGKYLLPEYLAELDRLREELLVVRPNLILALGNTACWAVLRATNIGSIRGAITESKLIPGMKCLPTYHPAGVLRQWSWRPIVVADLMKAHREAEFPEIRRPQRRILVSPTITEVETTTSWLLSSPPPILSCDTETGAGQIKCIGFAWSRGAAFVVPFVDLSRPEGSYWGSTGDELRAWNCVRALLESDIPKLFQNGVYDLQYLARMKFRTMNCLHDTMLLHHSLYPELQKGLGFLGSIYSSEQSWKLMRRERPDSEKRDE